MNKTLISLLLVVASLMTFALPVFAEESEPGEKVEVVRTLSDTTIEDDFKNLKGVEGNTFNESDYPLIPYADPSLLTVVEDCKLIDENPSYVLYFYIYNPGLTEINLKKAPSVQLSFDGNSYYKFSATRFGDSETGPFFIKSEDGRFLKFKVSPDPVYWQNLNKNSRTIYFSGFELSVKMQQTYWKYVEYSGGTYFGDGIGCSDKAVQFTFEDNNPSHMTKAVGIDALKLDLNLTYYRASNSNSGNGELNQLISSYFMIPKKYFSNYGMISNIHYEYIKHTDVPFFIANFDVFNPLGEKLPVVYFDGTVTGDLLFLVGAHKSLAVGDKYDPEALEKLTSGNLAFNLVGNIIATNDEDRFEFYRSLKDQSVGFLQRDSLKASSQDLHDYFLFHEDYLTSEEFINKNVSSSNPDDFLKSDSYVSSTNLWDRFLDYGLAGLKNFKDDSFEVSPIVLVDEKDLELSDLDFSEKYRIEKEEVTKVKQNLFKAKKADCRLVLLRFDISQCAVTEFDYVASLNDHNNWDVGNLKYMNDKQNGRLLYTENTVYRNFDIIDITFRNNQSQFVIPVVANPVDIYVPPTITPEDIKDKLEITKPDYTALIILAIVIVVVVAVTPHVSSFAGKVFGGPADRLVKSFKNRRGRNNRRR